VAALSTIRKNKLYVGVVYFVLLALVVPWYWPPGDTRRVLGAPLWGLATLLALLLTAIFTAWLYLDSAEHEPD
jgi:hypothetical protein